MPTNTEILTALAKQVPALQAAVTALPQKIADAVLATKLSNGYTVAQNLVNSTTKTDSTDTAVKAIASSAVPEATVEGWVKKALGK